MGTYYSLGIIHKFKASSQQHLTEEEWERVLNDRVDLNLFDLTYDDSELAGSIDSNVFNENIADFYSILRKILGKNRNENIDYYESEYGTEIKNYQKEYTRLQFEDEMGNSIRIDINFVLLFIEGKVFVEEFYTEPVLMNWLFKNSNIQNKLAGCIVSRVIG
jgi:hypothetical protein